MVHVKGVSFQKGIKYMEIQGKEQENKKRGNIERKTKEN